MICRNKGYNRVILDDEITSNLIGSSTYYLCIKVNPAIFCYTCKLIIEICFYIVLNVATNKKKQEQRKLLNIYQLNKKKLNFFLIK